MPINLYDKLAPYYHLMSNNWDSSIMQDGKALAALLPPPEITGLVLDCSCGTGTQLIALKKIGYNIEGSDISTQEVSRARYETQRLDLSVNIRVDDMRTLSTAQNNHYGAILTIGNSLPHLLSDTDILKALKSMKNKLRLGGLLLVSIRDYRSILDLRTSSIPPLFINDQHGKRIIHQVWEWKDERVHTVHLYITQEVDDEWKVHHFTFTYRAILPEEIKVLMEKVGIANVQIMEPSETGFCQPILKGEKSH